MSAPVLDRPAPPPPTPAPRRPRESALLVAPVAGLAVLLAGAPVASVVRGSAWLGYAAGAVAVVVAVGMLAHRARAGLVAVAQLVAALEFLVVATTSQWWPSPAAFAEIGALVAGAGAQIGAGVPPVDGSPQILVLVTGAFAAIAVAVHAVAVSARSPAAAAVPLLAVFAVPTALTSALLPWWAIAAPAAGLGLLLLTRRGAGRQLPAGAAMVSVAVVLALLVGSVLTVVGTSGRFGNGAPVAGGTIGLNAFTALRGQLTRGSQASLFEVSGLPRPQYMRALTLRDFISASGFQATAPAPGVPLAGPLPVDGPADGERATVEVSNLGFKDYWLPLYTNAESVAGLPTNWAYDPNTGTAYSTRQREDDEWSQTMLTFTPSAEQLRAATPDGYPIDGGYLSTVGVDRRVADIAAGVARGRSTPFDKTMALQDYFSGPGSQFHYSLQTAPGAGDDALVEFLTVGRTGYCEQFATAMAVMLRTLGVPARVAVGFTGGRDDEGSRVISSADAHAWVEAYFAGYGWISFDPTPLTDGRTIVPAYVEQARSEAAGEAPELAPDERVPEPGTPDPAAGQPPEPVPADQLQAPPSPTSPVLLPVLVTLGAILLLGLAAAPSVLRRTHRRSRLAAVAAGGPGAADQGWTEILAESTDRGVTVPPSDTVRAAARRLVREHRLGEDAQQALRLLVRELESSWYGGADQGDDPEALVAAVDAVRRGIAEGSPLSVRDRVLPRSLVAGGVLGRGAANGRAPVDAR